MKQSLFFILLFPLVGAAQNRSARFENDTLYTSGGYKIYKGQVLHLATGTASAGYFKSIKFHTSQNKTNTYSLQNSTIVVDKLKNFKNGSGDNGSIRITGTVNYKDSIKEETDIILNFDLAIQGAPGFAAELTVPEEFKTQRNEIIKPEVKSTPVVAEAKKQPAVEIKKSVADEIRKLFDLYKEGALTKEEYEAAKKKVLEKQ